MYIIYTYTPLQALLLAALGICGSEGETAKTIEKKGGVERTSTPGPSRQDLYEAAEDLWAKALALNTLAPEFRYQNNTEIAAQVGGEATFSCYTYHLSDEMVAWLKRDNDELLTVGHQVYVAEDRYSVVHKDHADAWELWVKDVEEMDAGQYECQLTTNPPVSYFFTLTVTKAEAVVNGPSEIHIEEGSHLTLECWVKNAPVPPVYIFWYHNNTMINYARQKHLRVKHDNYTSSLVVDRVRRSDAGIYSCQPHLAIPANITLLVVTGKRPAAMHQGGFIFEGADDDDDDDDNDDDDVSRGSDCVIGSTGCDSGSSQMVGSHYFPFMIILLVTWH